jgi:hypothetical protein
MKNDPLRLRGALDILKRALMHLGKEQRIDEWGNGRYLRPEINEADAILRLALWKVGRAQRETTSESRS